MIAILCALLLALNSLFLALAAWAAKRCNATLDLRSRHAAMIIGVGLTAQFVFVTFDRHAFAGAALAVALAAVTASALTDASTGYVFDWVTLPALVSVLIIGAISHAWDAALLGTLSAGGAMTALYAVTGGRGLGLGDVKLSCCIGGALGSRDAMIALALAFVLGGAYAAYLLIARRASRGDEVRFAPYLATGIAAVALFRTIW